MTTASNMQGALDSTLFAQMGETITYKKQSGATRSIKALVERRLNADLANASSPVIEISVLNDSTLGITSDELDTGTDSIIIAERPNKTAVERRIFRLVDQDDVGLTLELR